MKKEREGWKWKETPSGGFWVKHDEQKRHKHKLSFFCPHCHRITGTIDDKYLHEYGVCSVCYVMHIEDRDTPTIDLSQYEKYLFNSEEG